MALPDDAADLTESEVDEEEDEEVSQARQSSGEDEAPVENYDED